VEAVATLRGRGTPFRLLTNTTVYAQEGLRQKLRDAGIEVEAHEVLTPVTVTARHLAERFAGKRALVLASEPARDDLAALGRVEVVTDRPADVVVIGDAGDDGEDITYDQLNEAFRALMDGAAFIAMHRNLYWMTSQGLSLDVGAFVVGLEAASGRRAEVMGKPSPVFFATALASMGVDAGSAAMFGDDVVTDVGGAQDAGLLGVLVRSGKFREADLEKLPDGARTVGTVAEVPTLLDELAGAS
jgi:HAD superfamily hydrolase (TIGR01458 family)